MTNVSHVIHSLSFGDPTTLRMVERKKALVPDDFQETLKPMDGVSYVTRVSSESVINESNLHSLYIENSFFIL